MAAAFRALLGIILKDLTVWRRRPSQAAVTVLPALGLVLFFVISGQVAGRQPVALVVLDDGPQATRLVRVLEDSDAYVVQRDSADQAQRALQDLDVHAVITIPGNFDDAYDRHQPDPVTIAINNINVDITYDLRRSLPAAITRFYGSQSESPVAVHVRETDLRRQDVDIVQYELLPDLVLLLTVAGFINTGLATAREFEDRTIKEMTLSPVAKRTVVAGKLLAGWLTTLLLAGITLGIGAAGGFLRPAGWFWLPTLGMVALYALAASGMGAAVGAALRSIALVSVSGTNIAFYLFFLSGGISVPAFLPDWIQAIAHVIPTYYAVDALDAAVFYQSTDQLARDMAIVGATAIITVFFGARALRRGISD